MIDCHIFQHNNASGFRTLYSWTNWKLTEMFIIENKIHAKQQECIFETVKQALERYY